MHLPGKHQSLKYIACTDSVAASWCRLWDQAMDLGTKGTGLIQCLLSSLCRPVFGDRQCPHCGDKIPLSQNFFDHTVVTKSPSAKTFSIICVMNISNVSTISKLPRFWNRADKMCLTWLRLYLNFIITVQTAAHTCNTFIHPFTCVYSCLFCFTLARFAPFVSLYILCSIMLSRKGKAE